MIDRLMSWNDRGCEMTICGSNIHYLFILKYYSYYSIWWPTHFWPSGGYGSVMRHSRALFSKSDRPDHCLMSVIQWLTVVHSCDPPSIHSVLDIYSNDICCDGDKLMTDAVCLNYLFIPLQIDDTTTWNAIFYYCSLVMIAWYSDWWALFVRSIVLEVMPYSVLRWWWCCCSLMTVRIYSHSAFGIPSQWYLKW